MKIVMNIDCDETTCGECSHLERGITDRRASGGQQVWFTCDLFGYPLIAQGTTALRCVDCLKATEEAEKG